MTLCGARIYDCRCRDTGESVAVGGPHVHACGVPGCGAMWVGVDHVVRLPLRSALPRRLGRPVLRSVR